ncbi:MAG: hypothetical protein Q8P20_03675 [bacterium]|nr:hypothetical protein [bacterium]
MRLSQLQKYILLSVYSARNNVKRNIFLKFYDKQKKKPKKVDQQGIITRSMESLIEKGLMIGFGRRTPEKWFIEDVKLTSKGKKQVKKLYGEQQILPFKK